MVKHLLICAFAAILVPGAQVFHFHAVLPPNALVHPFPELLHRRQPGRNRVGGPNIGGGDPVKGQATGCDHVQHLQAVLAVGDPGDVLGEGLDARLLTPENIAAIKRLKIKEIHFAWDQMKNSKRIVRGLNTWKRFGKKDRHGSWGTVYVLTNFDTTMAENLFRIYTLDKIGFDPYVMIYDKENAPREIRLLQRWCNNKVIFKKCPRFEDYDPRRG